MDRQIRVLVADDLTLVRQGIRALLSEVDGVDVVGEAESADHVITLTRKLQPDVVLMDQDMPGNGLHATRLIKEAMAAVEALSETETSSRYLRNNEYWKNFTDIDPGKIVGWIFTEEEKGKRMKA